MRSLIVTTFGRPGYVRRALDAGAAGFLVKDTPARELADAVRRVHAGLRVVDPTLATESLMSGPSPLTARESEILRLALDGSPVAVIAARGHLSVGTVRNHLSAAIGKTGASTRAEAARLAQSERLDLIRRSTQPTGSTTQSGHRAVRPRGLRCGSGALHRVHARPARHEQSRQQQREGDDRGAHEHCVDRGRQHTGRQVLEVEGRAWFGVAGQAAVHDRAEHRDADGAAHRPGEHVGAGGHAAVLPAHGRTGRR